MQSHSRDKPPRVLGPALSLCRTTSSTETRLCILHHELFLQDVKVWLEEAVDGFYYVLNGSSESGSSLSPVIGWKASEACLGVCGGLRKGRRRLAERRYSSLTIREVVILLLSMQTTANLGFRSDTQ